jgi:hypothetical protein
MTNCPRCEVPINSLHLNHCTVSRCKEHGGQRALCGGEGKHSPIIWKGEWPGTSEAISRNWFYESADGDLLPDLNRVAIELTWNSELEIYE